MAAPKSNDPRTPDTAADKGRPTPALEPEDFGFTTIEGAEPADGQGSIPPTVVEPISSVPNSTFRTRSGKAVQSAEDKSIQGADTK